MITEFHWLGNSGCNLWQNYGVQIGPYIATNNAFIMCDQYNGDYCGSECDYWDEYSNYYTPSHAMSNWVKNQEWYTSAWDCAFKLANGSDQNIKQIWLWAGTGDTTAIKSFCWYAWYNGWLTRRYAEIENIWICDNINPCVTCSFPNSFTIQKSYFDGLYQYISYYPGL